MSRKAQQTKKRRARIRRAEKRAEQSSERPVTRRQLAITFAIAAPLVTAWIYFFQPVERGVTLAVLAICTGIACIIAGFGMAMPIGLQILEERTRTRPFSLQRRRLNPILLKIQAVLIPLSFLVSLIYVLSSPKKTWPSTGWIGAGLLIILVTFWIALAIGSH